MTSISNKNPQPSTCPDGLKLSAAMTTAEMTLAVCGDQRVRWERGERVTLEVYLDCNQLLQANDEVMIALVYGEFVLREESGESPPPDEYLLRFPHLASRLNRLFQLHDALSAVASDVEAFDSVQPSVLAKVESGKLEITETARLRVHTKPENITEPIPDVIGKYRIISQLGRGGQASVYRAIHPTLNKDVVIKISSKPLSFAPEDRDRLLTEGRILAELDHPNLARVYDVDFYEGRAFLVMEFVRGQTLLQLAQQRKLPPREAAEIITKVARALAVVHHRGIVHQDIKPANVIVDEANQPRLIDFGLAKLRHAWNHEVDEPGNISGTIAFMAPEQARGETERVSPCSDVFGLGAVLYSLLTGQYPFSDLDHACRCEFDKSALAADGIPRRLQAICLRAMSAEVGNRYPQAINLALELETFLRRPRLLCFWGLVAAMLLVIVGFLSFSGGLSSNRETSPKITAPSLAIRVWGAERYQELVDRVPLRTGDELEIRFTIPAGLHATMFLRSSDGGLKKLCSVAATDTTQQIRFPERKSQSVPLTGAPGTEFVFVATRRKAPIRIEDVRLLFQSESPWPALPGASVLRLGPGGVTIDQRDRGFGTPKDRPDPQGAIVTKMEEVVQRGQQHFVFLEGVAFSHSPE